MGKKIFGIYSGAIIIFFLFLLFILKSFSVQKEAECPEIGYEHVEEWSRSEIEAGKEGTKEDTVVYTFKLSGPVSGGSTLAIYSVHQNLHVYIEDEEVYTLQWHKGENAFGKTPGIHWNFINIPEKDSGKTVKIYVTSPYRDTLTLAPDFYVGDKAAICGSIIGKELPEYLVDFLLLIVGVIIIAFWVWAYRGLKKENGLLYLGTFAVVLAIWLGNDLSSTVLILDSPIVCSYISFIMLMLMPIPFVMYARELFTDKKAKGGFIICGLSIIQMIVSVGLQIFNIKDLRETVFLVHGMLGILFAWVIFNIVKEIKTVGFSKKMKINLVGMISCTIAAIIDVVIYYIVKGKATQVLCALTFLIYIIMLAAMAMKEAYGVLQLGKLAKKYQKMAYRDQLTGLYNRTAYDEMINDPVVKVSGAAIVMFDLNDLKRCNDVFGHAAGDDYIMQSARIISEAFENVATCYRIGGDEFCAIIPEEKVQYCEAALENLQKRVDEANIPKSEFKIHIAYGYAVFDEGTDKELNDTRSRADANMYRKKFAMKEEKKNLDN